MNHVDYQRRPSRSSNYYKYQLGKVSLCYAKERSMQVMVKKKGGTAGVKKYMPMHLYTYLIDYNNA